MSLSLALQPESVRTREQMPVQWGVLSSSFSVQISIRRGCVCCNLTALACEVGLRPRFILSSLPSVCKSGCRFRFWQVSGLKPHFLQNFAVYQVFVQKSTCPGSRRWIRSSLLVLTSLYSTREGHGRRDVSEVSPGTESQHPPQPSKEA